MGGNVIAEGHPALFALFEDRGLRTRAGNHDNIGSRYKFAPGVIGRARRFEMRNLLRVEPFVRVLDFIGRRRLARMAQIGRILKTTASKLKVLSNEGLRVNASAPTPSLNTCENSAEIRLP